MQLSNRLQLAAELVGEGYMLVDVGTDHGYIPIALMGRGKISKAYALDIHLGPLERAAVHIRQGGWQDAIIPVQSDGLQGLKAGKIESPAALLIAGMGGRLIISILEKSLDKVGRFERIVLSPHSDVELVRRYLDSIDIHILQEEMLQEDGKFYSFLVCVHKEHKEKRDSQAIINQNDSKYNTEELIFQTEYRYGKYLLKNKNAVLFDYLQAQHKTLQQLKMNMTKAATTSDRAKERLEEIQRDLCLNERALEYYSME